MTLIGQPERATQNRVIRVIDALGLGLKAASSIARSSIACRFGGRRGATEA